MFGLTRRNQDMATFNPWREMEEFEKAFFGRPFGSFFDASAFRQALFQLGQGQAQNTVHILGFDLVGIYAGDVKASLVGAVGALHADHFILLVLFLDLGFALSADDQRVILNVQSDILLLEAGQVSLQQVVVALVRHIGAELSKGRRVKETAERSSEKGFFEFLHLPPGVKSGHILISSCKSKHSNTYNKNHLERGGFYHISFLKKIVSQE